VQLSRRKFAAGGALAFTVGLAGCSSGSEETVVDDTREINEDSYVYWEFSIESSRTITYDFTVRSGPAVDLFAVNEEEFGHYENGERFNYFGEHLDSVGGDGSISLDSGEYVFVIDNTNAGEAAPPTNAVNDPVEVDITITVE